MSFEVKNNESKSRLQIKGPIKYMLNMPDFSTIQKPELVKKDQNFYKGNVNSWLRPEPTCKKVYQFYHQQNDDNRIRIEQMKNEQIQDNIQQDDQKKQLHLKLRKQDHERMRARKVLRNCMQYSSNQLLDLAEDEEFNQIVDDNVIVQELINKEAFYIQVGRAENKWNQYTQISKKYLDQSITPSIIQKDEEAFKAIGKHFEMEQAIEDIRTQIYRQQREETRQKFKERHLHNYKTQEKLGLIPKKPSSSQLSIRPISQQSMSSLKHQMPMTQEQEKQQQQNQEQNIPLNNEKNDIQVVEDDFPCKFVQSPLQRYTFSSFKKRPDSTPSETTLYRLAQPKNRDLDPSIYMQHSDFRDLLIGEVDDRKVTQVHSRYIQKLYKSNVLHQKINTIKLARRIPPKDLDKEERPRTALIGLNIKNMPQYLFNNMQKVPTKDIQDFQQIDQFENGDLIIQEIENFDKKFNNKDKKVGYPKVSLEEAIALQNKEGLKNKKDNKKQI